MPLPPSASNYRIGGMSVVVGGLDLGNVVTAEINAQDITVIQHFTARSGARKLDQQIVTQKRLFWRFVLDEHQTYLYRKYFMAAAGASDPTNRRVDALSAPLAETNISVTYRNESVVIWSFSHTRASVKPSAAMNFSDFNAFVQFDIEVEILEDAAAVDDVGNAATMGFFKFTDF